MYFITTYNSKVGIVSSWVSRPHSILYYLNYVLVGTDLNFSDLEMVLT